MNASTPNVETILAQAVEIAEPEQRRAFVEQACGGDRALQGRVEQLIANHFRAGSFLERPAVALDPEGTAGWEATESTDIVGTAIGPYKLLEQIGEGGMGLVFVAEQHEPIKRRVALKIIKPGMDTRQVIARFEAERQALALMDHPHIAKVHDGGATPQGRPYFVMELVKGIPITDFCDQQRLTTRQRLELFLNLCHAVQHAHQKGIIHRDLKPSNILVEIHDVRPVVKVIDFGIAKATGVQLTDKTIYTGIAQLVGTPLYMSPEQAGLSSLDVDTRSDVYSLGVLLYELLTGTTPFYNYALQKAGYDEMRRIIREEEPPRPSTRLSTMGQAALSTIAEKRGLEARRLSQQLRGELDWIVMKALEKDRNRRYESTGAFAADVQRFLSDEPVLACPPSKLYRLGKFVRRHKTGLSVAAVLLLALLLGASVRLWWLLKQAGAEGEARIALREASELLEAERWSEAISAARRGDGVLAGVGADAGLRQQFRVLIEDLEMAQRLQEGLLRRTAVKDGHFDWEASAGAYAEAFREYGIDVHRLDPHVAAERIQARSIHRRLVAALDDWAYDLRNREGRRRLLAVARAADPDAERTRLRDALEGNDPKAVEELVAAGVEKEWPVQTLVLLGKLAYKTPSAERVGVLLARAQQRHPGDFWINQSLVEILQKSRPRRLEEEIRFTSVAVALQPQSPGTHLNLGYALSNKGRLDEAISEYREAIRLKPDYTEAHNNLGAVLKAKGQLDEALAECREAIRLKPGYADAHSNLGTVLNDKGQLNEAIAEFREALRLKKDYLDAHYNLGNTLAAKGRLDEAIAEYRETIRINKDLPEPHVNLGLALARKGQLDDAIVEYREALKKDFPEAYLAHENLGDALYLTGQLDEAIAEYRKTIQIKKDFADAHKDLGAALHKKGQLDEAIAENREAIRFKKDYAEAHSNLGIALLEQEKFRQALEALRRAYEYSSTNPALHQYIANLLQKSERFAELDARLPRFLKAEEQPADAAERLALAGLCILKKLYAASARWYEEAFVEQPSLADDLSSGNRYDAACAAALAGCGQGKDAVSLGTKERGRLRRQALSWLKDDLQAKKRLLEKDSGKAGPMIGQQLRQWLHDRDLNGVRGAEVLSKLPEDERQAWQQLWADIADTLADSQRKATPKKKPDTK